MPGWAGDQSVSTAVAGNTKIAYLASTIRKLMSSSGFASVFVHLESQSDDWQIDCSPSGSLRQYFKSSFSSDMFTFRRHDHRMRTRSTKISTFPCQSAEDTSRSVYHTSKLDVQVDWTASGSHNRQPFQPGNNNTCGEPSSTWFSARDPKSKSEPQAAEHACTAWTRSLPTCSCIELLARLCD